MSYEGFSQFWCKQGHYWTVDCHDLEFVEEKQKCPICDKEEVFENSVNTTNGSFEDDGTRIDGYIKPIPEKQEILTCVCGNEHICDCSTYKIPKKDAKSKRGEEE